MITRQEIDTSIGSFLVDVLETENVLKATQNLVTPDWSTTFVRFRPIIFHRLSTNKVTYGDCSFRGTIANGVLTAVFFRFGTLAVGRRAFSSLIPGGVKILTVLSGSGTYGTYGIDDNTTSITAESDFASGYRLDTYTEMQTVQVDIYGNGSADMANKLGGIFRSSYACEYFSMGPVSPLYCSDGRYLPAMNDKQQVVDRWSIDLNFEIRNIVETAQQFADALEVGLIPVDIIYAEG